jgi:fibronectin type 3 domain-containing protein
MFNTRIPKWNHRFSPRTWTRRIALSVLLCALTFKTFAANLTIPNSGFETPVLSSGQFQYNPTGTSWTIDSGGGISANNSAFTASNPNAPEGVQIAFIQGNGVVRQTISGFNAGVTYTLRFQAAQRNMSQPGQTWNAQIDGVSIATFAPPQSAQTYVEYTATFTTTTGSHELKFQGLNGNGGDNTVFIDNVRIEYSSGTGTGLKGDYFTNTGLSGSPTLTRTDATVNFVWSSTPPDPSIGLGNYSVRWTGQVQPQFSETFTFYTSTDDGARLWVNGVQLVNQWTDHPETEFSGTLAVTANQKYDIVMEYYQGAGGATAKLLWSSPSTPKAIIPQSQLYLPAATPAAPSGLVVTAEATNRLRLNWTDNASNETGFKIERKTGAGGTYAQVATVGANVTTFTNSGLLANTTYFYRVSATNASGDSAFSTEASATTPAMVPAAPSALAATTEATNRIRLNWTDNASNESGFAIERKTGAGGTYAQVANVGANVTTYTNSGLLANTQYYYRVRATNAAGASAYSAEASATTLPFPPAAPSALAATAESSSSIRLNWTDNANNETGFKIERKTGAGGTYAQIATPGPNVTTYTNTGLSANTQYYYRVRANNTGGDSAYSAEANATTQGSGDVLNGIVGFWRFDENSGTTAADASGNNNTGTLVNGPGWIAPGRVGASALRFNDAGLQSVSVASSASLNPTAGITLAAWLYATNWNGNRRILQKGDGDDQYRLLAEWNELKFHLTGVGTLVTTLPATATWVHVAATWNGSTMVIYVNGVQQATTSAGGTLATTANTLSIGTKFNSGANGDYFLGLLDEVRIYNRGLSSAEIVTVMNAGSGGPTPPAAPSALAATTMATNQIRINWTDNATNETGFKIERKTGSGGTYAQIATVGPNATAYTNSGLLANTQYYYRVRATNSAGDSAFSAEANATTFPFPPAAPSGLSATPASSSQVNLSWTDNANNEIGFEVERKTGAGGTYAYVVGTGVNVTSVADSSGLTANTTYYYRVRANNLGGNSAYSAEVSVTTLGSGTGTGLVGEYFNNTSLTGSPVLTRTDTVVDFNWGTGSPHASVTADNFSVRWTGKVQPLFSENYTFYTYNDDGARLWVNGVQLVNDWTGHPATEFSGSISLTGGQQYDIVLEYFEGGGDAVARLSWSSASTAKAVIPQSQLYAPSPPSAPAAPSGLAASAVSSGQINLTWTDNANNETQFKVERKTGAGGNYAQIATPAANSTSFSDTTVSANTTYYYRVRANNSGGDSAFSNEANATTPTAPSIVPVIMAQGYDNILQLQITGTPGNWRLHDLSTRQLQSGYEWWYFVGSKIVKSSSNLTNEPWMGNHPGRVLKLGGKLGLDTFNRWNWQETPGYYDPNAGMFFEHGDTGGSTTFMFK